MDWQPALQLPQAPQLLVQQAPQMAPQDINQQAPQMAPQEMSQFAAHTKQKGWAGWSFRQRAIVVFLGLLGVVFLVAWLRHAKNAADAGHAAAAAEAATFCPFGNVKCNGTCTSLALDRNNCGGCGKVCDADKLCANGSCVCRENFQTDCFGKCVDMRSDNKNCGGCGVHCVAHASCADSLCSCDPNYSLCPGVHGGATLCVDTQHESNAHCGGCGLVCPTNTQCVNGACTCAPIQNGKPFAFDSKSQTCVDLTTVQNCGALHHACPTSHGACLASGSGPSHTYSCGCDDPSFGLQCKTINGVSNCVCVDLSTNANCGALNNNCDVVKPRSVCTASGSGSATTFSCECDASSAYPNECVVHIPPGDTTHAPGSLGSACFAPLDENYCGAKCDDCSSGEHCTSNGCMPLSETLAVCPGQAACESGCQDYDTFHCGPNCVMCGNTQVCDTNAANSTYGTCICEDSSKTACGNQCVDLQSDNANCGSCFNACSDNTNIDLSYQVPLTCVDGVCGCSYYQSDFPDLLPSSGPITPASRCANFSTDALHCGNASLQSNCFADPLHGNAPVQGYCGNSNCNRGGCSCSNNFLCDSAPDPQTFVSDCFDPSQSPNCGHRGNDCTAITVPINASGGGICVADASQYGGHRCACADPTLILCYYQGSMQCVSPANIDTCGNCYTNCDTTKGLSCQQNSAGAFVCACLNSNAELINGVCVPKDLVAPECVPACTAPEFCAWNTVESAYQCVTSLNCGSAETCTNGECVGSNANCSVCGDACVGGQSCVNNVCTCPAGETFCNGVCINLNSSSSCGTSCSNILGCQYPSTCSEGACICASPNQQNCSGLCVDLIDVMNCGFCGNVCGSNEACDLATPGGPYAYACDCAPPFTQCGGTCADTTSDVNHCGPQGTCTPCLAGQKCLNSQCVSI